MTQHIPYPCILKTSDSSCFVLIRVDDILVVGRREFAMQKRVKCLQQCYEVATEIMEKPGDEVSFLKRRMTLQHDDRITIETHHKHVDQMCSLLGLNRKLQNRKTPGHSDMDQVDSTGDVSPHAARAFRTCVDILLYLAYDLLHCQHIVRHLSTCPTQPTVTSMTVLKHLVSYLACHEDICVSLKWRGRTNGLLLAVNNVDSALNLVTGKIFLQKQIFQPRRLPCPCSLSIVARLLVIAKPCTGTFRNFLKLNLEPCETLRVQNDCLFG